MPTTLHSTKEKSSCLKVFISGSNGFLGSQLHPYLHEQGYTTESLTRNDLQLPPQKLAEKLENCYAVIHLAGAPILKRWTTSYQKVIYNSRVILTQNLVAALSLCQKKTKVFVSTSAIGIYQNEVCNTETDYKYADDFLAATCLDWEKAARQAQTFTRVCIFRMGVVLGKKGGALASLLPLFKLGLGGNIGSGKQTVSWVHETDVKRGYAFVLKNSKAQGVYNITAPVPLAFSHLVSLLAKVLKRPAFFPLPSFAVKLIFGQAAQVLLDSKYALPQKLQQEGFVFEYQDLAAALGTITNNNKNSKH